MPRFNRANRDEFTEPTVNLTPLIDVVFVILIIFIVIAPLLDIDKIALASSGSETRTPLRAHDSLSPIAIQVYADNSITLNGVKVAASDLEKQLIAVKKNFPTAHLQLFHDRNARFGTYQVIKNSAERAGFTEMDIILKS